MKYITRKPYRYKSKVYLPGEAMPVEDAEKAKVMQHRGIIGGIAKESAAVKPPERAVRPKAEIKTLGGGWYEVNGEKVQGRESAEEKARPFE